VTLVSETNYNVAMTTSAPPLDVAELASQLRLSVFRLARKLRREGEPEITSTLLAALSTIERHGTMTAGSLAAHEQIQKPTCTRVLADLQALGLIERIADPLDGRVAWVSTTPMARKLLHRVRLRRNVYLAKRMKRLPPEDLAVLERAATILDGLIEQDPA
jgi:DNA-binding MarR family transcriptional regulator